MQDFEGRVSEIFLDRSGASSAKISCPRGAIPAPGRYTLAWDQKDVDAPLAVPLFASEITDQGFKTAPVIPRNWEPGSNLLLRGPLGHGFQLPRTLKNLVLAAFGTTIARLMPLIRMSLEQDMSVALFTDCPLPSLPPAIEVHPQNSLLDALNWADFLVLDLPFGVLDLLSEILGLLTPNHTELHGQVLISGPMPCGGLAECGVCSIRLRRGRKLACKDGPVFELKKLV
jgi:dihydroorotate dehydrogenase electron transfer subunit